MFVWIKQVLFKGSVREHQGAGLLLLQPVRPEDGADVSHPRGAEHKGQEHTRPGRFKVDGKQKFIDQKLCQFFVLLWEESISLTCVGYESLSLLFFRSETIVGTLESWT